LITFYRLNSYDYFLYFGGEGIATCIIRKY
jgi:hypothetical protein